ncbi:DUF1579 domain-containing protein [Sphingomonas hylomeconis]|uniref:DUF1579 domain-containing protein n=1 Tax=Sphingomonas hylomeconis TaxID=1395958 RepID=A0ABV7SPG4_9SPHN|nr:DUF1579 domain-containing protein [Sphingomonas hylomeconis]
MPADVSADFDFQIGRWRVAHRQLKARLANCQDWEAFDGTSEMRPVLGGNGNIEDNVLHVAAGAYRALAIRSFDPALGRWAIWWLDSRAPHALDVPVVGHFENGVGTFLADDVLDGVPVKLRFLWLHTDTETPRWEQALSADGGQSWETNWTMDFTRA